MMECSGKMVGIHGLKICPFCGGNVEYAGITSGHIFPDTHTGQMYICERCGYRGSFILEVDNPEEVKQIEAEFQQLNEGGRLKAQPFRFPGVWMWFWRVILVLMVVMLVLVSLVSLCRVVA